jgi:hypothetical protein
LAFTWSFSLTSVTFQGNISSSNFDSGAFEGDLRDKYLAGGIGKYETDYVIFGGSTVWTKQ